MSYAPSDTVLVADIQVTASPATSTAASMMTSSSTATAASSGSMAERLILGPSLLIMAVVIGLSH